MCICGCHSRRLDLQALRGEGIIFLFFAPRHGGRELEWWGAREGKWRFVFGIKKPSGEEVPRGGGQRRGFVSRLPQGRTRGSN